MADLLRRVLQLSLAVIAAGSVTTALAQDYPTKPITLVVPYAAGGGNDVMARTVADKMSRTLGQQIVIENRAGAGGSTATRQVARSAPDGYTLVIGGTGTLGVNPTLYQNVGYDPREDFAAVGLIGTSALVVLVNPSLPVHSIRELIDLAKQQPGKLNYASAGVGSGIHLGTVLFEQMAGVRFTHIPYRGSAPALTDLMGGHVAIYFSSMPPALGLAREGKVRALAVTDVQALAGIPRSADRRHGRRPRLRRGAALWHRRTRRHAEADHQQAQCGAARCAACAGHAGAHGRRRHRAAHLDAGGIRR